MEEGPHGRQNRPKRTLKLLGMFGKCLLATSLPATVLQLRNQYERPRADVIVSELIWSVGRSLQNNGVACEATVWTKSLYQGAPQGEKALGESID
jgi:hypothetical protein